MKRNSLVLLAVAGILTLTACACKNPADTKETMGVTIVNEKNTAGNSDNDSVSSNATKLNYTYEDLGGVIQVYKGDEVYQELTVPDWKVSDSLGKNYTYLTIEDVNFDGYEDLVYLYELGNINAYYYAFLYHSESETFEACEEYVELANPELSLEEQMIVATDRTGAYTYVVTSYSWDGYTLVQEESMDVGIGDESGIYTVPEYDENAETDTDTISGEYVLGNITVGIIIYDSPKDGADGEFMAIGTNSKGVNVDAWGDLKSMGDNVYFSGAEGTGIVFTFTEDSVQIIDSRSLDGESKADLNGMYWK